MKALRNRAERALFVASPRDLPDLREDNRLHLSGVSLHESGISFGDVAEGYVSSDDLNGLVDDYLLSPAARSRANVILHVVPCRSGTRSTRRSTTLPTPRSRWLPTWRSTMASARRAKPSAALPTWTPGSSPALQESSGLTVAEAVHYPP